MFYSSVYTEPFDCDTIGKSVKLAKLLSNKPIYPGINCLFGNSRERIEKSIDCALENGADGIIPSWDYALIPYKNMNIVKNYLKSKLKLEE